MADPFDGLLGWKSIRSANLNFYRCPECGQVQESIGYESDRLASCYGCGYQTTPEGFSDARVRRQIVLCGACDKAVEIIGRNHSMGGPFYVCHACGNVVAFEYGKRVVSPRDVLRLEWSPQLRKRANDIGPWRWTVCKSKREHLVVQVLVSLAQADDESFLFPTGREDKAIVCFDNSSYIGYLLWSDCHSERKESREPVLRQVFVRSDWRRKGVAMDLIRTWADRFAFPLAPAFVVESPNEKTIGVLMKLGYLSSDRSDRCYRWTGK
jgi:hypothetical protein